jgi:hypothetical protein
MADDQQPTKRARTEEPDSSATTAASTYQGIDPTSLPLDSKAGAADAYAADAYAGSSDHDFASKQAEQAHALISKEQRTVYVSQLTQKTTPTDIKKYFKRKAGRVASIYFLTDKRTGRHKVSPERGSSLGGGGSVGGERRGAWGESVRSRGRVRAKQGPGSSEGPGRARDQAKSRERGPRARMNAGGQLARQTERGTHQREHREHPLTPPTPTPLQGAAYVELQKLEDVPYAVQCNGRVPEFQRFPILVRPSESEKNLVNVLPGGKEAPGAPQPVKKKKGSYRVYVGGIGEGVTKEQIQAVFAFLGPVENVTITEADNK